MSLNIWNVIQVETISYRLNLEAAEGQAQIWTEIPNEKKRTTETYYNNKKKLYMIRAFCVLFG